MIVHSSELQAKPNTDIVINKKDNNKPQTELIMEEGVTYYLEVERLDGDNITYDLVDKMESPVRTIQVKFEHNIMSGTTLTIVNPFQRKLDFWISMKSTFRNHSNLFQLPLVHGTFQKHWPEEFFSSIVISKLRLKK